MAKTDITLTQDEATKITTALNLGAYAIKVMNPSLGKLLNEAESLLIQKQDPESKITGSTVDTVIVDELSDEEPDPKAIQDS